MKSYNRDRVDWVGSRDGRRTGIIVIRVTGWERVLTRTFELRHRAGVFELLAITRKRRYSVKSAVRDHRDQARTKVLELGRRGRALGWVDLTFMDLGRGGLGSAWIGSSTAPSYFICVGAAASDLAAPETWANPRFSMLPTTHVTLVTHDREPRYVNREDFSGAIGRARLLRYNVARHQRAHSVKNPFP